MVQSMARSLYRTIYNIMLDLAVPLAKREGRARPRGQLSDRATRQARHDGSDELDSISVTDDSTGGEASMRPSADQ